MLHVSPSWKCSMICLIITWHVRLWWNHILVITWTRSPFLRVTFVDVDVQRGADEGASCPKRLCIRWSRVCTVQHINVLKKLISARQTSNWPRSSRDLHGTTINSRRASSDHRPLVPLYAMCRKPKTRIKAKMRYDTGCDLGSSFQDVFPITAGCQG